jgi:hypothetical protein
VDVGVHLGKPEGFQEFRSKTCARSAPGQHLDKCCENPSEGSIKRKECAKGQSKFILQAQEEEHRVARRAPESP